MFVNTDKAVKAGLLHRSLREIVRDVWDWHRTERLDEVLKAGLTRDREEALLRKWHEAH